MRAETGIHTLRHAQTSYGTERRYAGSIDVPLSQEGITDCLQAQKTLSDLEFDVVISSDLRRAVETAELVAPGLAPPIQEALCRERGFGVMEGMTWEQVQTLDPPILFVAVGGDLHSVNPQGGEPFEDLWERAKTFKRLLFREHLGTDILVVSHGVFLQMFHGVLRGSNCIESLSAYPPNLRLTSFRFSGDDLISETFLDLIDRNAGF